MGTENLKAASETLGPKQQAAVRHEDVAIKKHKVSVTTYVLFSGKIKNPMVQFTEGVNTFKIVPVIMRGYDADLLIEQLKRKQERGEGLTKEAKSAGQEEPDKVETVLYVMADKFLESAEMDELMEVIGMTRLGQKLVAKGIEQGIEQGKLEIAQNLIGLLDEQTIAARTELPLKTILELKRKKESVPTG